MAQHKRLHTPEGTPPSHRTLTTPHHSQLLVQSLHGLYEHEELCDYRIIAEGQTFKTHRTILASVSDYFRAMLTGSMLEARLDHVELKGVTATAVKELLHFSYTGRLALSMDDVLEIVSGASHLQMRGAVELCEEFLMTEISRKNCVNILTYAEMYELSKVRTRGVDYVVNHFETVVKSEQFLKLPKNHLDMVLQSNQLGECSELELFHVVRRWIEYNSKNRGRYVYSLMQHIRFALMSPEDLVDQVASCSIMSGEESCRLLIDEALRYHVLTSRQPLLQTQRTQVRGEPTIIALGGSYGINIGHKYNSNRMLALHPSLISSSCDVSPEDKWYQITTQPEKNFLYAAACTIDNFLYVCGGMGYPAHATTTCHRYDPRFNQWTRIADMNTRRQSFPLVSFSQKLFAFGGGSPAVEPTDCYDNIEHPPTDACEVYSVDTNVWTSLAPLPEKRKSSGACVLKGKIYVSGGRTNNQTVSQFWCYDPGLNSWSERRSMIRPHAGHAMMPHKDNKLFVIDRRDIAVESYSVDHDEWTTVSILKAISHHGVARPKVIGSWVYFLSFMADKEDYQCKRYNVITGEVQELPGFPEIVHCVIGACLTLPQSAFSETNNNDDE